MSKFKIVVEGRTDCDFLLDFIQYRFPLLEIDRNDFIITGTNSLKPERSRILVANELEENVLLIFDADADKKSTSKRIMKEVSKFGLEVTNQFYFPNNINSGNLETLLIEIVSEERNWIFDCIGSYGDCIDKQRTNDLAVFNNKSKVYIYSNAFDFKSADGKKEPHTFKRASLWNLNSEYLAPLYNFLQPYFGE